MINFDIVSCRVVAVRAVAMMVAVRRLTKPLGLDSEEMEGLERDFRAAAAELQRVEVRYSEDRDLQLKSWG